MLSHLCNHHHHHPPTKEHSLHTQSVHKQEQDTHTQKKVCPFQVANH